MSLGNANVEMSVHHCDVVVYGATSAGVMAAVQAQRLGASVVLLATSGRVGGLTSGGLGQTDIGFKSIIGGLSREFYRRIRKHYNDPTAWRWQQSDEYRDGGQTQTAPDEETMWTFEPSVASQVMEAMLREGDIMVQRHELLNRESGVVREGPRLREIRMVSGKRFRAKVFIDATYEGDLMAAAGVSYGLGRESCARYGETLNGVQAADHGISLQGIPTAHAVNHQLQAGVDPYLVPGKSESGLLPGIEPGRVEIDGSGDNRIQAYCFRLCLTDCPENRIPFAKPGRYDPMRYELLLRNLDQGENVIPLIHSSMPNRKTDSNNRRGVSTDLIGGNYAYPEATHDERKCIFRDHLDYTQGLLWTLAHHPRVPERIQTFFQKWGLCSDEFTENGGWPTELYVREARRMIGEVVMTQRHCEGMDVVEDVVGLAAYAMDSHHVRRYVDGNGHVRNEGNVQAEVSEPYPISYRSIVPRRGEAENLVVPVCLSASHVAFGSIRMEPVFMILGQSAAVAAVLAVREGVALQDVAYGDLRKWLLREGQVLDPATCGVSR
jgi:hypothetical protein